MWLPAVARRGHYQSRDNAASQDTSSRADASHEPENIQTIVFGVVGSLLALLAIYISYRQLRAMRRRRHSQTHPSPKMGLSPILPVHRRPLRTRNNTTPQMHPHDSRLCFLEASSRTYTFYRCVTLILPCLTLSSHCDTFSMCMPLLLTCFDWLAECRPDTAMTPFWPRTKSC